MDHQTCHQGNTLEELSHLLRPLRSMLGAQADSSRDRGWLTAHRHIPLCSHYRRRSSGLSITDMVSHSHDDKPANLASCYF